MPRYINADEALRMMKNSKQDKPTWGDWDIAHDCCIDCVEAVPTADVVEVTYCKNCKFRGEEDCPMTYYLELEGDYVDPMEDYDFCSYGERKEN